MSLIFLSALLLPPLGHTVIYGNILFLAPMLFLPKGKDVYETQTMLKMFQNCSLLCQHFHQSSLLFLSFQGRVPTGQLLL